MEDIIIPSFSFYSAFIVLTIFVTYAIKKIIRYKPLYPYIPVVIGVLFGFLMAFLSVGFCRDFVLELLKSAFIVSAGAIASYDTIVEKIEKYFSKNKGA